MPANLPVAFAALLAGGILLEHGVTSAKAAFAGGGGSPATSASPATGTAATGGYLNPLSNATSIGRTDQGVDATLPPGAAVVAPGKIKIIGIIPDWYAGQPAVFYQLLDGPDAGKVQYIGEQITRLPAIGQIIQRGQAIAIGASSGTGVEFGWGTASLQTLARATTGYVEGQATAAGQAIRKWLGL